MAAPRQYLVAVLTLMSVFCYVQAQRKRVEAPMLSTKDTVIYTSLGEKIQMDCTLETSPQSTKRFWKKDGQATRTNKRYLLRKKSSLLVINKVRAEDEGEFSCKAKNKMGSDEVKISVVIRVPLSVSVSPQGPLTLYKDEELSLTCASPGAPAPSFTWLFDDSEISTDDRVSFRNTDNAQGMYYSILTIRQLSTQDIGKFTCSVGQLDAGELLDIFVDVKFPPEITAEPMEPVYWWAGEEVTLTCDVMASERADIVWFYENLDGERTQVNDMEDEAEGDDDFSTKSVVKVNSADGIGSYECEATNGEGKAMAMFQVREAELPVVLDVRPVSAEETVLKVRVMMASGRPDIEEVRVGYMIEGDYESQQFDSSCELDDMNQCEVSLTGVRQYNYYVLSAIGRNMAGWGPQVDDFTPIYVGGSDLEWTYEYKTTVPPTPPTTTEAEPPMTTTDDMSIDMEPRGWDQGTTEADDNDDDDDMTTMSYQETTEDKDEDEDMETTTEDMTDDDMEDQQTTISEMPMEREENPQVFGVGDSNDMIVGGGDDSQDMQPGYDNSQDNESEEMDDDDVTTKMADEEETDEEGDGVTYQFGETKENSALNVRSNSLVLLAVVLYSVQLLFSL